MIALAGLITFAALSVNTIFAVVVGMLLVNMLVFKIAIILGHYEKKNKS